MIAMMSQSGEGFEPSQYVFTIAEAKLRTNLVVPHLPVCSRYAKFSHRGSMGGGGGGGGGGAGGTVLPGLMRPPPPNYICYRCGQKGHWIKLCPTNGVRILCVSHLFSLLESGSWF